MSVTDTRHPLPFPNGLSLSWLTCEHSEVFTSQARSPPNPGGSAQEDGGGGVGRREGTGCAVAPGINPRSPTTTTSQGLFSKLFNLSSLDFLMCGKGDNNIHLVGLSWGFCRNTCHHACHHAWYCAWHIGGARSWCSGDVSRETPKSLPLTYCVTLGMFLQLSELQFTPWNTATNIVLRMKWVNVHKVLSIMLGAWFSKLIM